ncbi:hypothetical protein DFH08DRAFT_364241 [Mycena albidolilacea]|uniref:Uncharacterized protein n=1 Tax=Mycena albidolilacea TaxID=1033008 RepID=A0AAD7F277_9AGAR|nr:hypothetical protein DFH08DRAFT_364241 [Mycena albidolilacea]
MVRKTLRYMAVICSALTVYGTVGSLRRPRGLEKSISTTWILRGDFLWTTRRGLQFEIHVNSRSHAFLLLSSLVLEVGDPEQNTRDICGHRL